MASNSRAAAAHQQWRRAVPAGATTQRVLGATAAAALAIDAYVHFRDAGYYTAVTTSVLSQATLFRVQAALAAALALALLGPAIAAVVGRRVPRRGQRLRRRSAVPLRGCGSARANPQHVRTHLGLPRQTRLRLGRRHRHHPHCHRPARSRPGAPPSAVFRPITPEPAPANRGGHACGYGGCATDPLGARTACSTLNKINSLACAHRASRNPEGQSS